MITFISQESWTDVWFFPLVICDTLSITHTQTHKFRRRNRKTVRETKTEREKKRKKRERKADKHRRVSHWCKKRWQSPDFDSTALRTWCWQRGQHDLSSASGAVISIIENGSYCVTLIWSVVNTLLFLVSDNEINKVPTSHQTVWSTWPAALCIILLCNDSRTDWLESRVWPQLIYLPFNPQGYSRWFLGTPQEEWLTLSLTWLVNCVSALGVSAVCWNLHKFHFYLLVLVLWNVCEPKPFISFYTCFSFSWRDRKASGTD